MSTPTLRALIVSPHHTYLSGDVVAPTPTDGLTNGLGALLNRVQTRLTDEGVLLLDARAAVALGLPIHAGELPDTGVDEHQALTDARAGGWQVSRLRPWTTYHAEERATVHVGILPAIDPTRSPVICPWPHDTLAALTLWHEVIGTAYRGTPGVAGMAALKALAAGGDKGCTWQPNGGPGDDAYELDYKLDQEWRGPKARGHRWRHGYDAYRMYLAAAAATPLTPWRLKPTGRVGYSKDRAGWWLVTIAPWQGRLLPQPIHLPDPAGHAQDKGKGPRWVTGPTLALLDELATEGIHGGYEVLDSWTGPVISAAGGRPLRLWAERLRDASYALPEPSGALPAYDATGAAHQAAVATAVKGAYRETWGLLGSPTALVRRPDWHYAILAQARVNLWRKMRRIGVEEKRWPLSIDVDNIWYSARTDDPVAECPKALKLIGGTEAPGLGKYRVKGSREIESARKAAA